MDYVYVGMEDWKMDGRNNNRIGYSGIHGNLFLYYSDMGAFFHLSTSAFTVYL